MTRLTLTIHLLFLLLASPLVAAPPQDHQYDIVKAGKLTEYARFVGSFHPQRDQKNDGTFTFGRTGNYLYAGAGFTSPDAQIHVKLSLGNSNTRVPGQNYGACLTINGISVHFQQDVEGRFLVDYGVKDFNSKRRMSTHAGPPLPMLRDGTPFEMDVICKDGSLMVKVNGNEVCYLPKCPQMINTQPKEMIASQQLGLTVCLRPWQEREMKVYDFSVETPGNIVKLPEIQEVFRGVRSFRRGDLKPGTTNLYRIPALLVTKKGTLLAFAEARRKNPSDHGDIDTVVRRSEDDGKTWGPELVVADDGDNTMGNPCPVVDQDTGRIWLHLSWNGHEPPKGGYKPGFGKDSRRAFVTYSDDDGKTWAPVKDITRDVKKENFSWYATGPAAGIQLTRGKYKGRLVIPATHDAHTPKTGKMQHGYIVYSDDHGKTWQAGGPTQGGFNETTAVELENGDVMLNCRLHGRATSSKNHRGVSISRDGGKTFYRQYFDQTLIEPRCQGSLNRVRWAKDGKPGVIAFSNPAFPWRTNVMVRYSYDDGKTWPAGRMIYPHTSAYSALATLPDGRVAVMHEKDWWGSLGMAILPAPPAAPGFPADAAPAKKVVEKTDQPKNMTLDLGKGVKMKMVLAPAGTFMMGSKFSVAENVKRFSGAEKSYNGAKKYFSLESPRHKVTITKPFYIGAYEITQPQYVAVMGRDSLPWLDAKQNPKMLTKLGPGYPASWVHWHEAMEFCSKLSKTLGRKVSLPTEAQWEYACRAGSETAFCFGDDPSKLSEYGWWSENQVGADGKRFGTRAGGLKKPNAWGLYDMHGNVWEWCRDWFDKDFYASGNNVDPVNIKETEFATCRGGSWYNPSWCLRSASRNNWYGPNYRHYNVGFRVVVE